MFFLVKRLENQQSRVNNNIDLLKNKEAIYHDVVTE